MNHLASIDTNPETQGSHSALRREEPRPAATRRYAALGWLAAALVSLGAPALADTCEKIVDKVTTSYTCTDALNVSPAPLYLLRGAAPNLIVTLDNSTSMLQADANPISDIPSNPKDSRGVSSATNPMYYNPENVYSPPLRPNGYPFPSIAFDEAPLDFFRSQFCSSCSDDKLVDALDNLSCFGEPNSTAVCETPANWPSDGGTNYWGCTRKLSTHYVAINLDAPDPCLDPRYTSMVYFVRDPDYAALLAAANPQIPTGLQPANPKEWALLCQDDRLPPAPYTSKHLPHMNCPAYYYRLDTGAAASCATIPPRTGSGSSGPGVTTWINTCLKRAIVGDPVTDVATTSATALAARRRILTNCPDGTDDIALAKCNFANWFSFYRNRWLALRTVLTRVLAPLDESVRVAYQGMKDADLTKDDPYFQTQLLAPFGGFDQTRRERFQNWLFASRTTPITPLLQSAVRVHNFYMEDTAYLKEPHPTDPNAANPIRACRNNFHLLFTDGAWDSINGNPSTLGGVPLLNNDGPTANINLPTSGGADTYAKSLGISAYGASGDLTQIYRDANVGGLADVVFYSWITDLRPNNNDLVATLLPVKGYISSTAEVFWNPKNDPADWQHVTTYTIGFGLTGKVTADTSTTNNKIGLYSPSRNLVSHGFPTWTDIASTTSKDKVDDLWHAGLNGRGGFSSANDPKKLVDSFSQVITAVSKVATQMDSTNATPVVNSGSAAGSRYLFMASFETGNWTGDLKAYRVSNGPGLAPCDSGSTVAKGEFCDDPNKGQYWWSAADHLDGNSQKGVTAANWSLRTIATGTLSDKGQKGISLADFATQLNATEYTALVGDLDGPLTGVAPVKLVDYLRGDHSLEDDLTFRVRASLLGDIINGAPTVVSAPYRDYTDNGYSGSATSFQTSKANREELVYVGANDGMLHAFAAGTGVERFAYVPPPLFAKLRLLADPGYGSNPAHTAFVDAPPAEGDAYLNGSWKSVVVGGLGMGAQAVYAIHSPDDPAAAKAADIHLWDFTDADDARMGYVLGKPAIVRVLKAGGGTKWVAVFGNGINSSEKDTATGGRLAAGCTDPAKDTGATACGQAVLYVVDLEKDANGLVSAAKFYTGKGIKDDERHAGTGVSTPKEPNGLSQPTILGRVLTDAAGDPIEGGVRVATFAYAGDLFGNLWRFNLTYLDANEERTGTLVFQAKGGTSTLYPQPITTPVAVAPHPIGPGLIVLFGTGRYLTAQDPADTSLQTFYGIWDRVLESGDSGRTTPITHDELQPQYFTRTDIAVASGTTSSTTVAYGRTSTRVNIAWAADPADVQEGESMGWRIDLGTSQGLSPAEITAKAIAREQVTDIPGGERVVVAPTVRGDRVIFASLVPETNECEDGGYGWITSLAAASGSALDDTPFDYNQNGTFDTGDLLATGTGTSEPGSSIKLTKGGILTSAAALPIDDGQSKLLLADHQGKLVQLLESSAMQWRVWMQLQP